MDILFNKKINDYKKNKIFKKAIYIVPTPIGNLLDVSLRSLIILENVDLIVSENINRTKILLNNFSINNKIIKINDFIEKFKIKNLLCFLSKNNNIALVSDSGTPLINDPGFKLIFNAIKNNFLIIPLPGPCAAITALSASGLSLSKFCYEGFLPKKKNEKINYIKSIKYEKRTIIFYEVSNRLLDSIVIMMEFFDKNRKIVVAKELTKKWEFIYRDSIINIFNLILNNKINIKGEIVLIIEGNIINNNNNNISKALNIFNILKNEFADNKSISITSKICNINKNILYKEILKNK